MHQQMTNGSTSSTPPKALANGTSMVTPNSPRNSLIILDDGDDASLLNVSMNGGETDDGGANDSELVPTEDEELVGDITTDGVVNKDGLVQVPESVSDTVTEDELARINTEIADAQHLIEISTGDTLDIAKGDLLRLQHLLDKKKKTMTSSGEIADGGLKDTRDDMAIDENASDLTCKPPADPTQRLGFSMIGGIDTVDQLTKKVVNDNTAANTISSL